MKTNVDENVVVDVNIERDVVKEVFHTPTCIELLNKFEEKEKLPMGKLLNFTGVKGKDVYNITAPFIVDDKLIIAGRVEGRKIIADSRIVFFEEQDGLWVPVTYTPVFKLEDGFLVRINGEIIFGGVDVYPKPSENNKDEVGYRTVFFRGKNLQTLTQFAIGPDMMKDIRLVALADGRIGVFTRPQGVIGGRGKIGYIEIDYIEDLNNSELILGAKIIENQFAEGEWGGANDPHLLDDGRIGVIGHIAYQDDLGGKHYYAMSFIYNPKTHFATPIEIIATIKNFPDDDAKFDILKDIVYPSNLVRKHDGTAVLYVGLRDAKAGYLDVPDCFV